MKTLFNLTSCREDLARYADRQDLLRDLAGFDGLELMDLGPDPRGILPPGKIIGLHTSFPNYWLDFWRGDEAALLREFGSMEVCQDYYGGLDPQLLAENLRRQLAQAKAHGAEYMVFHGADCSIEETFTQRYAHSDEEVIQGICELLNQVFPADMEDGPLLLIENLWHAGFHFTEPEKTELLLSGLNYPRKGLMLDTGHLMHTKRDLRSPEEAVAYIRRRVEEHGPLCRYIRGIHLNLSLTGDYTESVMAQPPALAADMQTRYGQLFQHIFRQDQHRPFLCGELKGLLRQIRPDYLIFEFISESREQMQEYLAAQREVLTGLWS